MTTTSPLPLAAGKSSFELIDRERFFAALPLAPDATVLDLACGSGAYALELARRVPQGTVHALDLWVEGIAKLRAAAQALGVENLYPAVADAGAPLPLPGGSIDLCLTATVLHDLVEEGIAGAALAEIARVVHPGGILAVVEFEKVDSHPGPPAKLRLSPAELEALVVPHGFRPGADRPVGEHLYLTLFHRT